MKREIAAIMEPHAAERACASSRHAHIEAVEAAGLAAVMTDMSGEPSLFSRLVGNTRAIKQALVARQQLFEHLLSVGDVLPVQPGTRLADGAVKEFLLINADLLRDALGVFAGHVQFQLTVRWDPEQALGRFAAETEFQTCASAQDHASAAEALRKRLGQEFGGFLDTASLDRSDLPIDDVDTLVNCVLLINRRDLAALDRALERIDAVWTEGLRVTLTGPLPPLSFGLIAVRSFNLKDRQAALALLGGVDGKDPAAVQRAFRTRVKQSHEDTGGDCDDFAPLLAARDLLIRASAAEATLGRSLSGNLVLAEIQREGAQPPKRPMAVRQAEVVR